MEILSKEMIKPSSPTPHHLRNHKLSFLDQLAPSIYIPLIFFYQPDHNKNDVTKRPQLLKQTLSNTLTQYYPLAGRISNESFSVDCNDAGIEYIEARVHAQLAEVIEEPSMEELRRYLPKEPHCKEPMREGVTDNDIPLLAIQINFFDCGGMAIAACVSHKIADGSSLAKFMNSWAATSRGHADDAVQPLFDWTSHFPPKNMPGFGSFQRIGITEDKLVTKRFVFDKEKLATLKAAAAGPSSSQQVKDPTRVEAVTAFFWRHFIQMDQKKKSFAAVHAVNLRPRMSPPLPQHSFGNIWWHTFAVSTPETNRDYQNLVGRLRNAIKNINIDYINGLRDDEILVSLKKSVELYLSEDVEFCSFSSWCRFPLYEVDYGWGKPTWVCTTALPFKNLVILMSTRCGEGIEAWVNMVEDDVPLLQSDLRLLSLDVGDDSDYRLA